MIIFSSCTLQGVDKLSILLSRPVHIDLNLHLALMRVQNLNGALFRQMYGLTLLPREYRRGRILSESESIHYNVIAIALQ